MFLNQSLLSQIKPFIVVKIKDIVRFGSKTAWRHSNDVRVMYWGLNLGSHKGLTTNKIKQ